MIAAPPPTRSYGNQLMSRARQMRFSGGSMISQKFYGFAKKTMLKHIGPKRREVAR